MTDLIVPDVSEWQGAIDWAKLRAACPAVIIRAHNGYGVDKFWTTNAREAAKGRWWGAYQYLPASKDAATTARALVALVAALPADQRPDVLVLDLEEGAGDQSARQAAWLGEVHARMAYVHEWTYSGLYFLRAHGLTNVQWVAAYSNTEPSPTHALWQFSSSASIPGVAGKCDASRFHGSIDDLIALTNGTDMPLAQSDLDAISRDLLASQLGGATTTDSTGKVIPLTVQIALDRTYEQSNAIRTELDALKAEVDALKAGGATIDYAALAKAVNDDAAKRLSS